LGLYAPLRDSVQAEACCCWNYFGIARANKFVYFLIFKHALDYIIYIKLLKTIFRYLASRNIFRRGMGRGFWRVGNRRKKDKALKKMLYSKIFIT